MLLMFSFLHRQCSHRTILAPNNVYYAMYSLLWISASWSRSIFRIWMIYLHLVACLSVRYQCWLYPLYVNSCLWPPTGPGERPPSGKRMSALRHFISLSLEIKRYILILLGYFTCVLVTKHPVRTRTERNHNNIYHNEAVSILWEKSITFYKFKKGRVVVRDIGNFLKDNCNYWEMCQLYSCGYIP